MYFTAVVRHSKPYLTEYELEEIKHYTQVWYLGKKANKTCHSMVNKTQGLTSFDSDCDTEEGFYKAVSTQVFTVQIDYVQPVF